MNPEVNDLFSEIINRSVEAAADLLVYSREELERFRNSKNHIIAQALKKGKVLYARL